jgi:hypothetical protein
MPADVSVWSSTTILQSRQIKSKKFSLETEEAPVPRIPATNFGKHIIQKDLGRTQSFKWGYTPGKHLG